jgi:hypothetical protein
VWTNFSIDGQAVLLLIIFDGGLGTGSEYAIYRERGRGLGIGMKVVWRVRKIMREIAIVKGALK